VGAEDKTVSASVLPLFSVTLVMVVDDLALKVVRWKEREIELLSAIGR
jgi:hypothetical protein